MKTKPWIAINLLTNEVLGNYEDEYDAWAAHAGEPVDILYRPNAREVK